jgi:hypothetical protein
MSSSRFGRRALRTAALVASTLVGASAWATPLLSNIIVNGNAEANLGDPNFGSVVVPAAWTTTGNFSATQYAAGGSLDLNTAASLALGGGINYFSGGIDNGFSTASQSIDLSDLAGSIDGGLITAAFSALIGGFNVQEDNMTVEAIFRDATNAALLTLTLGPVSATERANESTLLARAANAVLPAGARSVDVVMTSRRLAGFYNDGYADNLSLVLRGGAANGVPLPSTAWLAVLGVAALAAGRRRKAV